jgi:hypothetical protein
VVFFHALPCQLVVVVEAPDAGAVTSDRNENGPKTKDLIKETEIADVRNDDGGQPDVLRESGNTSDDDKRSLT